MKIKLIDHPIKLILSVLIVSVCGALKLNPLSSVFWITNEQQANILFYQEQYQKAAKLYEDFFPKGAAHYKSGNYKEAATAFSRLLTAEGFYNQGLSRIMIGEYDSAVEAFEKALEQKPHWKEAQDNLAIAKARRDAVKRKGGKGTGGKLGADDIVFEKDKKNAPSSDNQQDAEFNDNNALSEMHKQALWLGKNKPKPATFLRAKLSYQSAIQNKNQTIQPNTELN